jgi:N-acetylneuraminic acid mutarotase
MNRTFILPAVIEVESLPDMPVAITNNAVALLSVDDELRIYSLLGLESGKTWADASSIAMQYTESGEGLPGTWKALDAVPGEHGRLAASAVAAGGEIYLFGGYTVASDGAEESTPEVFRLDGESGRLVVFSTMPVPVEDSVVAVYQDRWIYLVRWKRQPGAGPRYRIR